MYQYSFANTDLIIEIPDFSDSSVPSSFKVRGFGTGEGLISAVRKAPIANTTFGAYGDMIANMQRILAGDLVFPVLMSAPENSYLQKWANHFQAQADQDGSLIKPLQARLVDNMGNDKAEMSNGVILAMPAMVRGQTMNTVTWVITFERMTFKREVGGDNAVLENL